MFNVAFHSVEIFQGHWKVKGPLDEFWILIPSSLDSRMQPRVGQHYFLFQGPCVGTIGDAPGMFAPPLPCKGQGALVRQRDAQDPPRALELFSGIGGWHQARKGMGGSDVPILSLDIDPIPARSLAQSTNRSCFHLEQWLTDPALLDAVVIGDIRNPAWWISSLVFPFSEMMFSAPCVPWSVAGKQRGLKDFDGQLFLWIPSSPCCSFSDQMGSRWKCSRSDYPRTLARNLGDFSGNRTSGYGAHSWPCRVWGHESQTHFHHPYGRCPKTLAQGAVLFKCCCRRCLDALFWTKPRWNLAGSSGYAIQEKIAPCRSSEQGLPRMRRGWPSGPQAQSTQIRTFANSRCILQTTDSAASEPSGAARIVHLARGWNPRYLDPFEGARALGFVSTLHLPTSLDQAMKVVGNSLSPLQALLTLMTIPAEYLKRDDVALHNVLRFWLEGCLPLAKCRPIDIGLHCRLVLASLPRSLDFQWLHHVAATCDGVVFPLASE